MTDRVDANQREQDDWILEYATLFKNFDTDASLQALASFTDRLRVWKAELDAEIDATRSGRFIDPDLGHTSVYRDALFTQVLTGAVAPFIEGTITHGLIHLRDDFEIPLASRLHPRWQLGQKRFWSVKSRDKEPKGLVAGFFDLVAALDASGFFPAQLQAQMDALFDLRNACFHNGLEWPPEEREAFHMRCAARGWDNWFKWSMIGGEKWIVFLTPEFVTVCENICQSVVTGFEQLRICWSKRGWDRRADLPAPPEWMTKPVGSASADVDRVRRKDVR